ncbi:alpha/beta fold hydrolase [Pseudonocardia cypriaca]|uniref:Pimeloyl-ACP methyl ester carboxylesterase n=1 Tax=Pseudonocardia cypriaca TaxID=882449 RepID=A0A543GGF3_9PSEU|nr:alpha/beta hydrolase [Pseudonocardia cypriaca]TQM45151.1 pimeloyl-ACP methyl ester carboxylesterase [Pseudonocardia cypriaca]
MDLPLVEVPGGRVEYEDVPGDRALAPLLFLHEGLGSVRLWRRFHHRLAAATGRRAVAFSRLGHGGSDLPPGKRTPRYMHDEATEVVPAVRAALGLDGVVLVGHSDGGSIALLHAGTAAVEGVVVLAPHVFVEEAGLRGIEQARRDYVDGDLRSRMARYHRDPDVTFWNWNDGWLDGAFRDWDIRPELAGITCPVLGVQGTADPYGTVVHVEAVRDRAAGPVTLEVLDCGHAPHLERPGETDAAVKEFLRSLE